MKGNHPYSGSEWNGVIERKGLRMAARGWTWGLEIPVASLKKPWYSSLPDVLFGSFKLLKMNGGTFWTDTTSIGTWKQKRTVSNPIVKITSTTYIVGIFRENYTVEWDIYRNATWVWMSFLRWRNVGRNLKDIRRNKLVAICERLQWRHIQPKLNLSIVFLL